MAGHGSPPAPDKANHPGRKVDQASMTRDSVAHWKAIAGAGDLTGERAREHFTAGDVAPYPTRQEVPRRAVRSWHGQSE